MHVYFVRHGETDLNRQRLHQSSSTPLNTRGYDQARTVAEMLRPTNPTLLVSSTYERAMQTARVIELSVGLPVQQNTLFREVERPASLSGVSHYSFGTLWFLVLSVFHRNKQKWRYKDAENFFDIYARVQRSFHYIESLAEAHDSIIVVSHAVYINLLMYYMCHGERLSLRELLSAYMSINELKNGGVLHVEYVGYAHKGTCAWIRRS